GAPRPTGPSGQRPALSVALKGPLEAPRRSEDVSALVNWLTLRSVEREAKRVEAAERAASRMKAQEEAALRRAQEAAAAAAAQRADQPAGIPDAPALNRAPDLPATIDIRTPPVTVPATRQRQAPAVIRPAAPLVITPPSVQ